MAEYIDREDYCRNRCRCDEKRCIRAICPIWKAPKADVAPVRHGRWIWHEGPFEYECSACHLRFDYNHTFGIFDHGFEYAEYCPNCGAKMDGGADNGKAAD